MIGTAHDVADARTHRTAQALRAAGLTLEVIGRGHRGDAPEGAQVKILPSRGLRGRVVDAVRAPIRARGRVLLTIDPDPLFAASLRRLVRRNPLVADCHEDYASLLQDRAWARGVRGSLARGVAGLAVRLAARADLTAVADEHVPPLAARDRLVVQNLPSGGYLPEPAAPDDLPRAVYVGDVRRSRGLRTMLEAIEQAPGWQLDVVGPVSPADREWLDRWCSESPSAARVTFHGRMTPEQAWARAAGAWVGLCLLDLTPAFVEAMPSKVYEYLECGLPVLVTGLPKAVALIEEVGAGFEVGSASAAANALRAYQDEPEMLLAHRAAAVGWARSRSQQPSPYDTLAVRVAGLVATSKSGSR